MKKIAKLSLVAAVAVAGLTTANAQPLEEAIKNVDVSGSVVYRYNDNQNSVTATPAENAADNNYKIGLNLSSKVNEDVKFNSRVIVGSQTDGDFVSLDTAGHDGQADISLSNAYFGYTGLKNTTVNVGKQGLTTPWTVAVQADGNEQTGTGILALSTVGPVTFAGAYFNQTNLDNSSDATLNDGSTQVKNDGSTKVKSVIKGNEDIATVGAIVAVGPATLDAWYIDAQDLLDSYTIGAKAATKVSGIDLTGEARFASLELDPRLNLGTDANTIAKIVLTADAGLVDAKVAYATTSKDGGLTALDKDASTTLLGWNLNANGKADANYWQAVLGFDILSNLNLSANYGDLKYAADATHDEEEKEAYAQLLYTMSKNLTTYVRYGTYTKEESAAGSTNQTKDYTTGRLQVKYTF